jgi:hypothetical protein
MYTDLINNKTDYSFANPKTIVPIPTESNYETGFMERYFCQRVNDKNGFIFEIDSNIFKEFKENPYWKISKMRWRISGVTEAIYNELGTLVDIGVIQSNKNSIAITSSTLKNISLYLPNLLQFHK